MSLFFPFESKWIRAALLLVLGCGERRGGGGGCILAGESAT